MCQTETLLAWCGKNRSEMWMVLGVLHCGEEVRMSSFKPTELFSIWTEQCTKALTITVIRFSLSPFKLTTLPYLLKSNSNDLYSCCLTQNIHNLLIQYVENTSDSSVLAAVMTIIWEFMVTHSSVCSSSILIQRQRWTSFFFSLHVYKYVCHIDSLSVK